MEEAIKYFMHFLVKGDITNLNSMKNQGFPFNKIFQTNHGPTHILQICYQYYGHAADFPDESINFLLENGIDPNFQFTFNLTQSCGDFLTMIGMNERNEEKVSEIMKQLFLRGYLFTDFNIILHKAFLGTSKEKCKFLKDWNLQMLLYCLKYKNTNKNIILELKAKDIGFLIF
jgi:hypothetical protein